VVSSSRGETTFPAVTEGSSSNTNRYTLPPTEEPTTSFDDQRTPGSILPPPENKSAQ